MSSTNGFANHANGHGHSETDQNEEILVYKKDGISATTFKIVYDEADLQSENKSHQFKPDMAHQIFGESESIFGYRNLKIDLYYLHNSSNCYVDIKSSGQIPESEMYKPDNIITMLNPWLPTNFVSQQSDFLKLLNKEKHDEMFGTVLEELTDSNKISRFNQDNLSCSYKFTICELTEEFKDFHRRFETFIVWFIDAANFIDLDDERWMIFYVYEECEHPTTKQLYRSPVGYCSVYKFYCYPSNIRARISQFFILPTHQKKGLGTKLYQTVIKQILSMPEVTDITVEEPTDVFQKLRDFSDTIRVYQHLQENKVDIKKKNFKQVNEYMKQHKICKKQCQRVIDLIDCMKGFRQNLKCYDNLLKNIKNRIEKDFERLSKGSKRICNSEKLPVSVEPVDKKALIDAEYNRYISELQPVIEHLNKYFK